MTRDEFVAKWWNPQAERDSLDQARADLDALIAAERAKERELCIEQLKKWRSIEGAPEAKEVVGHCIAAIRALEDTAP